MFATRIAMAAVVTAAPLLATAPAAAQTPGFTAVGEIAEYRIDGVRDGQHQSAPVRFLDMTLRNTGKDTTFPATMQEVWWQGRTSGEKVRARRRDLTDFGMYDFVKPGQVISVTYVLPVRADVGGITIEYDHAKSGPPKRSWTWAELATETAAK